MKINVIHPLPKYEDEVQKGVAYYCQNEPHPHDFVLPGLIRQSVGVLVAAGSTGKSFFAIQACMSIAAGRDLFGLFGGSEIVAGPVAYLALEDPLDVFWHRIYGIAEYLRKHRTHDEYIHTIEAMRHIHLHGLYGHGYRPMDHEDLTPSAHFKQTISHVKKQGARLVVVDTYSRFLSGQSETDNAIASTLVALLEQLCKEANTSVLIIHHTNKMSQFAGEQGNQGAARGASALTDNARYQMNMWTMPSADAERHGVLPDDRKQYVFAEATKTNHMAPQGLQWLQRRSGGVLVGIDPLPEVVRPVARGQRGGGFA